MAEPFTFNAFSFFSGTLTGLILDWTDIIPILGGFILGFSVKKMPEFMNTNDIPVFIKKYIFDHLQIYQKSNQKNN